MKKIENLIKAQTRVKDKETKLNQRLGEMNRKEKELSEEMKTISKQKEVIQKKQNDLDENKRKQIQQLEEISNFSAEKSKNELVETLKEEAKTEASE